MDTPEQYAYRQVIQHAQERYERDHNEKAYLATRVYLGLQRLADEYGNPKAKMTLAAGQHVIKGAVQMLVNRFFDPHHPQPVQEDFVHEMIRHAKDEFSRDLEPLKAYLANYLGIRL